MTYTLTLANIIPAASAFTVLVNSVARAVSSVSISGTKVRLALASPVAYGDIITVSYTKPASNPLQTGSGGQAASLSAQPVTNNCLNISPSIIVTYPINGSTFTAPATITITANASDVDGTISKVEFFNDDLKLGEINTAPYSYTWNNVDTGIYLLTAIATDDLNATTTSSSVQVFVKPNEANTEFIDLFPNPNSGRFSIRILKQLKEKSNIISIFNSLGENVHQCILLKEEITKQFDLPFLNSGLYILMISGNEIYATKKFIKN